MNMANRKLKLKEVHDVERFNNTIRASIIALKQVEKNLDNTLKRTDIHLYDVLIHYKDFDEYFRLLNNARLELIDSLK